jgi:hypothetical protein
MKRHLLRGSLTSTLCLPALACSSIAAGSLLAQEGEPFRVSAGVGYRAEADIDNNGGDFSETRFGLGASRGFRASPKLRIEPALTYRFSAYDFSGREPWDDIHTLRATVLGQYAVDDRWTVFGGPSIGFSGEADADVGDALTFGGAFGASYKLSEGLVIGGGFTASTEIEDGARIRPLAVVNWRINDRWSIESGYTDVAAVGGPGGEIRYRINDAWSVAAGVQYHEKRFRLSDDASVPEGVGEDSSFPIYAKATWQVCPNAALELVGGVAVGGELTIENRNGRVLARSDYDPAPLVGLRAVLTF